VLVRIYGNQTELLIDRDGELKNLTCIHANGFAAPMYGYFANGFIYGFHPGRDLMPEDLLNGRFTKVISRQLASWHGQEVVSADPSPSLWHKLDSWISMVPKKFSKPEAEDANRQHIKFDIAQEAKALQRHLTALNSPVAFSHNDLQGKNIIYDEATDDINFIDFEYSSYNYRAFDLANHFCEFGGLDMDFEKYPTKEQQMKYYKPYLKTILGRSATPEELESIFIEVSHFSLASHFLWATWGLVQAEISQIDFDFMDYAIRRYNQYFNNRDQIYAMLQTADCSS